MGIKVNLTDGQVELGGDFWRALAFVKAIEGRSYDGPTKTWTVPMTLQEFDSKNHAFPMDVLVGNSSNRNQTGAHHTRYGNVYTRDEWDANKAIWKMEAEVERKYAPEIDAVKIDFVKALVDEGISENAARSVLALAWDFEEAVDRGKIQFSSQARQQLVGDSLAIYRKASEEVWTAKAAEIEARTNQIVEGTLLY